MGRPENFQAGIAGEERWHVHATRGRRLILTVEGYAQVHLAHHKWYFDPQKDPDFIRKQGEEWRFPKRKRDLFKLFLIDATGINTLKLIRGKKAEPIPDYAFGRPLMTPAWVRIAYYLAAIVLLTVTESWSIFLLYWLVPILTITQLIVRWGAICEHKYNLPNASVVESTPLIVLSWWERLLLPNLNFAMHPYHHYFPGVAHNNLPKVHEIYAREGLIYHNMCSRAIGLTCVRWLSRKNKLFRAGAAVLKWRRLCYNDRISPLRL
jgi:fatty acid desaturase